MNYEAKYMNAWDKFKLNMFLKTYTFLKIPLIYSISPEMLFVDSKESHLRVPLKRKTKNHLNVMYFGAIAIGAELCIAMVAVKKIVDSKKRIDFLFKDFKANFIKRVDGDIVFVFRDVESVAQLVTEAMSTSERINKNLKAVAYVPTTSTSEIVGEFELTMTVKSREKKS